MTQQNNTRQALLEAACQLFAEHGYDAVSTRMIAETAQVNLGGIHYHFGSKEKLYVAAFNHATAMDDRCCISDIAAENPELMETPEGQAEIIRIATLKMFDEFFFGETLSWKTRIMLRELSSPSSAQPILAREVIKPALTGDMDFIRRIQPGVSEQTALAWANMLHAQAIFHLLCQGTLKLMFGVRNINRSFYETTAREAANALILLLGLPLDTSAESR